LQKKRKKKGAEWNSFRDILRASKNLFTKSFQEESGSRDSPRGGRVRGIVANA